MKKFLPLVLTLVLADVSQARIGETLDECKSRYGSLSGQLGPDEFTFNRDSVTIIVHLINGRSVREDFVPEAGKVLSAAQVDALMRENAEGSTWEILGETASVINYSRADKRATAQRGKANTSNTNAGNVKLTINNAELIIKYTAAAARKVTAE